MGISVALCTYNGAKYILKQLESIAQQTLQPTEMVVCDDGSTDNTIDIIQQFSSKCSIPFRIYVNEERLGVTCNFKKAISLCNGEMIALCDQDDVWLAKNLEQKVAFLKSKENAHINVVFSDLQLVDQNLELIPSTMWKNLGFTKAQQKSWKSGHALDILIKKGNVVTGASVVLRAQFRDRFMQYLELPFSDWIHDAIIAVVAAKDESIQFIEPINLYYRQHGEQQFGAGEPIQTTPIKKRLKKIWRGEENVDRELIHIIKTRYQGLENFLKLGVTVNKLKFVSQTLKHMERRRKILRQKKLIRLFLITREFFMLRYKKYSNSTILSPIRDLMNKRIKKTD